MLENKLVAVDFSLGAGKGVHTFKDVQHNIWKIFEEINKVFNINFINKPNWTVESITSKWQWN
jgi:hypothetical protein